MQTSTTYAGIIVKFITLISVLEHQQLIDFETTK